MSSTGGRGPAVERSDDRVVHLADEYEVVRVPFGRRRLAQPPRQPDQPAR